VGKVMDIANGKGLRLVSISAQNLQYGVYECSTNGAEDTYGGYGGGPAVMTASAPSDGVGYAQAMPLPAAGLRHHHHETARSTATSRPATHLNVYYEQYLSCSGSNNADGSSTRPAARTTSRGPSR